MEFAPNDESVGLFVIRANKMKASSEVTAGKSRQDERTTHDVFEAIVAIATRRH